MAKLLVYIPDQYLKKVQVQANRDLRDVREQILFLIIKALDYNSNAAQSQPREVSRDTTT